MKKFLLLFFWILFFNAGVAQIIFQKNYRCYNIGGTLYGNTASGRQTSDGGFIVAGNHWYGHALLKTDSNGDTLWTKTYGNGNHTVFDVQQTRDKGFIISASTSMYSYYGVLRLIKTDSLGDTTWTRLYSNTCPSTIAGVKQTFDGGYIVAEARSQWCTQGGQILSYYKIKTNGDTSWCKRVWGGGTAIALAADSGFILAGCSVIKTNKYGDSLWVKAYGNLCISAITATSDGGYMMGGSTYPNQDFFAIKTDANGDTLWTRTYGGIKDEKLVSVKQTKDGGYIFGGTTKGVSGDSTDIYLVKTTDQGDTLWTRTIGRPMADEINNIEQTTDGGYIMGARSEYAATNMYAGISLIKTDSIGRLYNCNEKNIITTIGYVQVSVTRPSAFYQPSGLGYVHDSVHVDRLSLKKFNNCSIVGISTNNQEEVKIYPNPSSENFTVESGTNSFNRVEIFDVLGNLVLTQTLKAEKEIISIENINPGVYVLFLSGNGQKINRQLYISR